jgi:N-methylhydantoinase A
MNDVVQVFVEYHQKLYDYVEEAPPEIMNIRLSAFGNTKKPKLAVAELGHENSKGAMKTERNAYFHELGKSILTPVYDGQKIFPGNRLSGPAIIELPTTTIVIRPGQSCFMDELSNFNINS